KLREQMISAAHNATPNTYTLHAGMIFTTLSSQSEVASRQAPILQATAPCAALLLAPAVTPLPSESGRPLHQYRKKERQNRRRDQECVRAIGVCPARYWCPFRHLRIASNKKSSPQPDSSLRRALALRPGHVPPAFRTRLREQNP